MKGEIQLLHMRSENSQNKVIEIDEQMGSELKKKQAGEYLIFWKTCGKRIVRRKKSDHRIDGE